MTAVGYSRVSTDKQDNSSGAQNQRIRAYALLHEIELTHVEEDSDEFSGDLDRPGIQRVLKMVREKHVDAVIITKLDRISRSVADTSELMELFRKTGVKLIDIAQSLDMSCATGRLVVNMRAAIAQWEREMIGERTSEGLQNLKAQGFPAGPAPYGWQAQERTPGEKERKVRKLMIPNLEEQAILKRIGELRAQNKSWTTIADALNAEKYKTRSGGPWPHTGVARRYDEAVKRGEL